MKPLSICIWRHRLRRNPPARALIKDGHRVSLPARDRETVKHLLMPPDLPLKIATCTRSAIERTFRAGTSWSITWASSANAVLAGGSPRHTELTRAVLQDAVRGRAPAAAGSRPGRADAPRLPIVQGRPKLHPRQRAHLIGPFSSPRCSVPATRFNRFATPLASGSIIFPAHERKIPAGPGRRCHRGAANACAAAPLPVKPLNSVTGLYAAQIVD
jgi:hypothetical protein